jgi:hypothetical protein
MDRPAVVEEVDFSGAGITGEKGQIIIPAE